MAGPRRAVHRFVDGFIVLLQLIIDLTAWVAGLVGLGQARVGVRATKARGSRPARPTTAALVFAEPNPEEVSVQRAANLTVWCASHGIQYIYMYDPSGQLKSSATFLLDRIRCHPAAEGLSFALASGWPGLQRLAGKQQQQRQRASNGTAAATAVAAVGGSYVGKGSPMVAVAGQRQADVASKGQRGQRSEDTAAGSDQGPKQEQQQQEAERQLKQKQEEDQQQQERREQQRSNRKQRRRAAKQQQQQGSAGAQPKGADTAAQPDQLAAGWHTSGNGSAPNSSRPDANTSTPCLPGGSCTCGDSSSGSGAQQAAVDNGKLSAVAENGATPAAAAVTVHLLSAEDGPAPAIAAALQTPCNSFGTHTAAAALGSSSSSCCCASSGARGPAADPARAVYAELAAVAGSEILREPQLLLVLGPALTLAGYPPFHTRGAQIYHLGPSRAAGEAAVRGALERYTRALQRHGA